MKKQFPSTALTSAVIFTAGAALLKYPSEVSAAVRSGLTLCTDTLLPSLFPFFILSSLIIKLELFRPFEHMLDKIMRTAFHLPGSCSSALVLGMIGGYPTGAKAAVELYKTGACSRDEAQRLLGFCNNCGPAFLFGAVGCGIFGHPRYGLLLMGVHYSAAILTGLIMNRCTPVSHKKIISQPLSKPIPLSAAFVDSVTGSLRALFDLFSFVLCFSAIIKLISISGLSKHLALLLHPILSPNAGESFLLGLLEMTHGVFSLSGEHISTQLTLTAALLGWGGVSVHCQVFSLLYGTDLSAIPYVKGKALHGILSAFLTRGVLSGIEPLCLAAGGALLFLPCRSVKKSSGKSAKGIV